jgi:hypothetical protein
VRSGRTLLQARTHFSKFHAGSRQARGVEMARATIFKSARTPKHYRIPYYVQTTKIHGVGNINDKSSKQTALCR